MNMKMSKLLLFSVLLSANFAPAQAMDCGANWVLTEIIECILRGLVGNAEPAWFSTNDIYKKKAVYVQKSQNGFNVLLILTNDTEKQQKFTISPAQNIQATPLYFYANQNGNTKQSLLKFTITAQSSVFSAQQFWLGAQVKYNTMQQPATNIELIIEPQFISVIPMRLPNYYGEWWEVAEFVNNLVSQQTVYDPTRGRQ